MAMKSLWLDNSPHRSQAQAVSSAAVSSSIAAPSWMLGIVRATSQDEAALPEGWVRVAVPHDNPTTEVTGMCDGGITAVGAVVQVKLDGTGRVMSISAPVSLPDGASPVPVGAMGKMLTEGLSSAKSDLEKSREQLAKELSDAEKRLNAADIPTDRIKPGAHLIGGALLADGAVTASKVVVNNELWARIANVARVTTDMLVAGEATIAGTAIVGDLMGNRLLGGELALLDSDANSRRAITKTVNWTPGEHGTTLTPQGDTGFVLTNTTATVIASATYSGTIGPEAGTPHTASVTVSASGAANVSSWRLSVSYRTADDEAATINVNGNAEGKATVTLPERSSVFLITVAAWRKKGAQETRFTVNEVKVEWNPLKESGLRIWRDKEGTARLDVNTGGGRASLTSEGLTYYRGDEQLGSISWPTLVQPPAAVVTWPQNAGGDTAANQDGLLHMGIASDVTAWGGCAVDGWWLTVPTAGWYQIEVACGFMWRRAESNWSVAVGMRRRSKPAVQWVSGDPAMTLPLIPGVTTRPSASALVHCDANEGLCLAYWQNTGAWRPNSGPSRMSARLIQED